MISGPNVAVVASSLGVLAKKALTQFHLDERASAVIAAAIDRIQFMDYESLEVEGAPVKNVVEFVHHSLFIYRRVYEFNCEYRSFPPLRHFISCRERGQPYIRKKDAAVHEIANFG